MYLFGQGTHYDIYNKLGAHPGKRGKTEGVYFDVWAPNAKNVWVIGSFNDWKEKKNPMKYLGGNGVFEAFVPSAKPGDLYKYLIETQSGELLYKADPYANYAELRPGTASRVADIAELKWSDQVWMKKRKETEQVYEQPMSIYEVHLGSWKRHPGKEDEGFYTYREMAPALTEYVKEMGRRIYRGERLQSQR